MAVSIHFDSDHPVNRLKEVRAVFDSMPAKPEVVDVIAGDFNQYPQAGAMHTEVSQQGFINTLFYLGQEEWTSPFFDSAPDDKDDGLIDHILVRHATPLNGYVANLGVWQKYPHDEARRIAAWLQLAGSDHFAVVADILVPRVPTQP